MPGFNGYPQESDLERRIRSHFDWRGATETVSLLWQGYLSGLLEYGLLDINAYNRLMDILPNCGSKDHYILLGDEPLSPEVELEIEENDMKLKNGYKIDHGEIVTTIRGNILYSKRIFK